MALRVHGHNRRVRGREPWGSRVPPGFRGVSGDQCAPSYTGVYMHMPLYGWGYHSRSKEIETDGEEIYRETGTETEKAAERGRETQRANQAQRARRGER